MIDFPIDELLDDSICTLWLERHLHSDGLTCPHYGRSERRLFRIQGHFPAYRCRACEGYDTLLTGTVFAKTRQRTGNREYGTLAQRYLREFDAKWLARQQLTEHGVKVVENVDAQTAS